MARHRAITFGLVLLSAGAAAAQPSPLLREGIERYDALEYEAAIERLSAALLRPGNTREDQITIYEYLGLAYFTLGRREPAEGAFRNLFALDPDHAFDATTTAPEIVRFHAEVYARWDAEGRPGASDGGPRPIRIQHLSPAEAERGAALVLVGTVDDAQRISANLVLAYRTGSRGTFKRVPGTGGPEGFRATVPAAAVRPPLVEYYLEVVDANGLPLATRGDADAPLRVPVPAPARDGGGVLGSWWFWAGAGVLALGGAAAVILATSGGDAAPEQGTFIVRLVPVSGE